MLSSSSPTSECVCDLEWYDLGIEECKRCNYSWFNLIRFLWIFFESLN